MRRVGPVAILSTRNDDPYLVYAAAWPFTVDYGATKAGVSVSVGRKLWTFAWLPSVVRAERRAWQGLADQLGRN